MMTVSFQILNHDDLVNNVSVDRSILNKYGTVRGSFQKASFRCGIEMYRTSCTDTSRKIINTFSCMPIHGFSSYSTLPLAMDCFSQAGLLHLHLRNWSPVRVFLLLLLRSPHKLSLETCFGNYVTQILFPRRGSTLVAIGIGLAGTGTGVPPSADLSCHCRRSIFIRISLINRQDR